MYNQVLRDIVRTIKDDITINDLVQNGDAYDIEVKDTIENERTGKNLHCFEVKHTTVFHLNGDVLLPNGKREVLINGYMIPGYFLLVREFDTQKKCYTSRNACVLCGTIRHTVTRAWTILKRGRVHITQVEDVLEEAGFPDMYEFDEFTKSPIKRKARKSREVNGNAVNNKTVVLTKAIKVDKQVI